MQIKKIKKAIYMLPIAIFFAGCLQETLPSEKFYFDEDFFRLYKAVSDVDTLLFENNKNNIDTFILTKIDSTINNQVNCFMCPPPAKSVFRYYKQYPINYCAEIVFENQGKSNERTIQREVPLVTITKYPDSGLTTAHLSFKNFRCIISNNLGKQINDTLRINDRKITDYYVFSSDAKTLIVNQSDIELLFVSLKEGIIAYKEKSGIIRKRIGLNH